MTKIKVETPRAENDFFAKLIGGFCDPYKPQDSMDEEDDYGSKTDSTESSVTARALPEEVELKKEEYSIAEKETRSVFVPYSLLFVTFLAWVVALQTDFGKSPEKLAEAGEKLAGLFEEGRP